MAKVMSKAPMWWKMMKMISAPAFLMGMRMAEMLADAVSF
jgi:hypothetical protein